MNKTKTSNGNAKIQEKPRADLGLSPDAVEGVISLLTKEFSDIQVLYVKTLFVQRDSHSAGRAVQHSQK